MANPTPKAAVNPADKTPAPAPKPKAPTALLPAVVAARAKAVGEGNHAQASVLSTVELRVGELATFLKDVESILADKKVDADLIGLIHSVAQHL